MMNFRKINSHILNLFFSIFITIATALIAYFSNKLEGDYFISTVFIGSFVTFIVWEINLEINRRLKQKYPIQTHFVTRVQYQLLINVLISMIIIRIYFYFYFTYIRKLPYDPDQIVYEFYLVLIFTLLVNTIYLGIELFSEWKKNLIETEALKKMSLQSQYEALKNQVNPHFLFNSLNTLASIIPEDPNLSVEFVQKLSSVYRYVLKNKDKELIDIATELGFIKSYLFLQKIRFGENIQVQYAIPEKELAKFIPPMSLQILVENAIKHNIIAKSSPLKIEIACHDGDYISVKNNFQKKHGTEESTGIGLDNLYQRYSYLSSKKIDIEENRMFFKVSLPIIQKEEIV